VTTSKSFTLPSFIPAFCIVFSMATGCTLLTELDLSQIDETGGAAGSGGGGAGGATTSTGGGGGSGGACAAECCAPSDCPVTGNECLARACEAGACGTKPVAQGVLVSTQTPGDCQVIVCDGAGATETVIEDRDLPDDANPCTVDKCEAGTPKNTSTPAGEPCAQSGGTKCDGSGACVECLAPSDCESKVCTVIGSCAPAQCGDSVQNGDETGIDCGGVCGPTCGAGQGCGGDGDCLDHLCNGATGECSAPACDDGVENGDETDLDCGGACGPSCSQGETCAADGDCKGGICSGSFCLPSCTDGELNNGETALDCGGPVCTSTCATAEPCVVASDCTSAFCVDALCCATACDTACSACSAALKGSGADGECGAVPQGTDPHADCGTEASSSCGDSTGVCDGAGACEKWPVGTPCGDAASCSAGVQTNPDQCDGLGECANAGTVDCGLYACGAAACNSTCSADADCGAGAYCAAPACAEKQVLGAACAGSNQCASGFCADGFCCDAACNGTCEACSAAAGGVVNGMCAPIANNQDPAGECGGTGKCDGDGSCKKSTGQACILASECLSGSCADGFCCNTPCVGLCQACSNLKKGSGANGSCGFVGMSLDPDDECPGTTTCSGGTCVLDPLGSACTQNGECASGFCVDGFCCGSLCQGFCQACSAAKTGASNGACDDITAGTDPEGECPGTDTCDGNLGCMP
jgi:hypothetical protein